MQDEQKFYSRNIEATHIVAGYNHKYEQGIHTKHYSKIIPRSKCKPSSGKRVIIGGENPEDCEQIPPTIILEKKNEQISKISVNCPCGRHAELTCEYE